MMTTFIRNHQYNLIKKQAGLLQRACQTVSDPKVVESVRYSAQTAILDAFPDAGEQEKQQLDLSSLRTPEQFRDYLNALEPYLEPLPPLTAKQLAKLFPKVKKLKAPDLSAVDTRYLTYLGWADIATNKLFIVYHLDGQWVGIEGRQTPTNKGVCFVCNRHEEVALFSAVTKWRPANASPEYYKAIGNYLCVDSSVCNKNITNGVPLEKFVREVTGNRKP